MGIFKPKDIVYANLPSQQTHEQSGTRPVVIVQDENTYGILPTVIIIPFTLTQKATRFPSTIVVDPSSHNGLKGKSVLLPFQMMAIDRRRLTDKIGELEDNYFNILKQNIKSLLQL